MSKFGKGLTYCIGLFLAHADRQIYANDYSMWFYGAADHLYDLELPNWLPEKLEKRLKQFQGKCITWRLILGKNEVTKKDFDWAINEAKSLLMLIDKHFNVKVKKAQWE